MGRVRKREDSRLFNPKAPKKDKEEDKIDKILGMIKDLHMKGKNEGMKNKRPYNKSKDIECKICLTLHHVNMVNL